MTESNRQTLQSYEANIQKYIQGTPQEVSGAVGLWIDRALYGLDEEAKIIEIGSAFGRDAEYIESKGYKVERTDATHGFVELLKEKGYDAQDFNLLIDEFHAMYDLVFADAVLLHLTRDELKAALAKIYETLMSDGRFAFSLKHGEGEVWSDSKLDAPRFFCYWTESQIKDALEEAGFNDNSITTSRFGKNNPDWLHIIARKN